MPSSSSSRRNSVLLAAAIAIGFAIWIASGSGGSVREDDAPGNAQGQAAMRVAVRDSRAQTTQRRIEASARTEPDRAVEIKAETEGRVIAIGADRGAVVAEGQPLVDLDMRDRQARRAEAEALIRQRELEFAAAERLQVQGFMSEAELAAAEALLVSSRAALERIELDMQRTRITAPFDAVVYERAVEIGDYVGTGDSIAQLVDADPMIVVGNINERDVGQLEVGSRGLARVLGGEEIEGTIRYIAPVADESTRTFRVELAIPNPDLGVRVGTSAQIVLDAEMITAHLISPSLLTLADDGTIGVKIVDEANRVRFVPVGLPASASQGLYVTGLPKQARVITVGQGFVADGQAVIPVDEADASAPTEDERAY